MATERKFARFSKTDRPMQTREIPEGGFCISTFVVLNQTGFLNRVVMGRLNTSAAWDHIGALDPERAEANSKGWMLPSSHLVLGESPATAASRILKEQLGVTDQSLARPRVFSEEYGRSNHWDLSFLFTGERAAIAPHPAWRELAFVDTAVAKKEDIARSHEDILAELGRWKSP